MNKYIQIKILQRKTLRVNPNISKILMQASLTPLARNEPAPNGSKEASWPSYFSQYRFSSSFSAWYIRSTCILQQDTTKASWSLPNATWSKVKASINSTLFSMRPWAWSTTTSISPCKLLRETQWLLWIGSRKTTSTKSTQFAGSKGSQNPRINPILLWCTIKNINNCRNTPSSWDITGNLQV